MRLATKVLGVSLLICLLCICSVCAEATQVWNENFDQWNGEFTESSGLSEDFYYSAVRVSGDANLQSVKGKFGKENEDGACCLSVSHLDAVTGQTSPYIVLSPKSSFQTGEDGVAVLEFDFAVDEFNNLENPQISVGGHLWTTYQDLSGEANYKKSIYDTYGKYEVSGKIYSYLKISKNCITAFENEYPLLANLSAKKWHRLSLTIYPDNTYSLMVDDILLAWREKITLFSIRYRYLNTSGGNVDVYRTTSYFRGFKEIWFQYYDDKNITGKQGYYLDNITATVSDTNISYGYQYPYCITGIGTADDRIISYGFEEGKAVERIYLKKLTDGETPVSVMVALYYGEILTDIAVSSFTEPCLEKGADESLVLDEKLILPEDVSNYSLKIMLWEDGKITPLANVFNLNDTGASSQPAYMQKGFSESEVIAYAKDALILRSGNHQCYLNNIRADIIEGDSTVYPYIKEGSIYAPLMFLLNNLGFEDISERALGIVAYKNGIRYMIREGGGDIGCEYRNDMLYADVKAVAETAGLGCYMAEDVIIVSNSLGEDASVPQNVMDIISQRLEYRWKNVYLGSRGYVTGMVAHPRKNGLIYARTDVGGMYRYNAQDGIWKQLMTTIPLDDDNLLSVRSIALDPNDENIVYAACGANDTERPADVLKSVDKGENWVRLQFNHGFGGNQNESRLAGECLAVDPNDSDTVYCGTYSEGLFVSRDAGAHWKKIMSVPQGGTVQGGVSAVYIDADSTDGYGRSRYVYAAVWGKGIYVSDDGGVTFAELEGSPKLVCHMEKVDGKMYVSATDVAGSSEYIGGFFCLVNGQWQNLTPDTTDGYTYTNAANAFLIDKNNHNVIYLNGAPYRQKVLMRSIDGGESWEYVSKSFNASCLLQNPLDESGIWIPYGAGISYISNMYDQAVNVGNDAENNKYKYDKGIEELVGEKVLSIPSENAPVLLSQAMDFGMMRSSTLDDVAEVSDSKIGHGSGVDYCADDPSIVLSTGIMGRVQEPTSTGNATISFDYGNTFTTLSGWGTTPIIDCAVGAQKQENGYPILLILAATTTGTVEVTDADKEKSGLYRSVDLGKTWKKITGVTDYITNKWGFDDFRLAADRVDGNTFYYTNSGKFYVTTDGGNTWTHTYTFSKNSNPFIKAVPGILGAVWYKDADGIYVSYDKGKTWNCINGFKSPISFGFGIGKNGEEDKPSAYAAGEINGVYGIYLSDDLGMSWRRINDDSNCTVGYINDITGDSLVYGRVFLSSAGAGVVYGVPIDE